jgi:endo-1,4-beta-xylanase
VGTCLTYNDGFRQQLEDKPTMEHVRKNYNSFTLENDMKPSFLLSDSLKNFRNPVFNQLITVNDAIAQGYYIPDNYTEYDVPEINYTNIDKIMQIAADNGIRMRAHTLIWHSQTPTEFFREGYQTNGSFVDPATMDQRIIYYVTNVVKHICESPNSSVVYTWDICNEYFHQSASGNDANWAKVYDLSSASGLTTTPSYVKLAFKTGYDVLKKYNLQDSVPLFYNDYNTSQVADKIVEMVNYINSKDEINPDGEKICAGVGMQCHLGLKWPSVEEQLGTVQKFLDAGFEVQITELDIVNDNGSTEAQYCDYWYYFMKGLVDRRVAGAKITGVTFWGLCDDVSWRFGQSALLYGKSINDPKKNLYAAYAAAQSSWGLK